MPDEDLHALLLHLLARHALCDVLSEQAYVLDELQQPRVAVAIAAIADAIRDVRAVAADNLPAAPVTIEEFIASRRRH